MSFRSARTVLLVVGLLLVPAVSQAADASLGAAYAAILRGDYDAGQAAVASLIKEEGANREARQVQQWLKQYHDVVASRKDLKSRTFDWNVKQAREALEQGSLYLALSFASQAAPYALDREAFSREAWVKDLTIRCRAEAREHEQADRWSKALSYYALLLRIHEDNEELEALRDAATEHARIEFAYEDREALQRRIQDVDQDLLRGAVRMIHRMYYHEPDFRRMARGAIDNLITLCKTTKLHGYLDGLANPALRNHFVRKLTDLRREIDERSSFDYKRVLYLFEDVKQLNRESVELPRGLLVVEFVEGLLGELDDFTGMIWPVDAVEFDKAMMGGFEGVGIQLSVDERTNRLKVVTPLENSPALEAGLQPDDLIVRVDGESTKGWTTNDAVRNISGPGGSEVVLTIFRPRTGKTIEFPLTRRRIELTTVRGVERTGSGPHDWNYLLDGDAGVAYIRLTNFLPKSEDELRDALSTARRQGMEGLILDLRHNPGGLLDVAINIVSTFLEEGEVVSTRGRATLDQHESVRRGHTRYADLPLVILVNEGSASASEILAGALQDHHRAVVLGGRTFGKGSVQHVRGLSGGDARLKLTTALYYLPSGRTPHKAPTSDDWGVLPDWALELTPKEFRRVLERERESYIIHNEDQETARVLDDEALDRSLEELRDDGDEDDDDPPLLSEADIKLLESDPHDAPDVDPQLETALLLVRVKLAAQIPWPKDLAAACKTDEP